MADNALNGFEISIGGGGFIRQDIGRVEDVEAFILHRAEIEIAHGNDIEHAEIIFAGKHFFVPDH